MKRRNLVLTILLATLWSGTATAGPRAYVHSDGSDGNVGIGCPSANPCRTFDAAMNAADDNGEIVALDTEDFGPVKVWKSITIIGNGRAGIVATSFTGAGVNIVKAGIHVVLRGLDINGVGKGGTGILMKEGASLQVEDCVIANFAANGVVVTTPAHVRIVDSMLRGNSSGALIQGGATADIVRSRFIGNRGVGLLVNADSPGTTSATVSDSIASSNGLDGFSVNSGHKSGQGRMMVTASTAAHNRWGYVASASDGDALITVGRSTASHNKVGLAIIPGVAGFSTFESMGDNSVRQNDMATMGLVTVVPGM